MQIQAQIQIQTDAARITHKCGGDFAHNSDTIFLTGPFPD